MSVFRLDETQAEELAETGSVCSQCLRDAVQQLLGLHASGDVSSDGVVQRLEALVGRRDYEWDEAA